MAATSGHVATPLQKYGPYEIFTRSQNQYPANDLRKNFSTINYFDIKGQYDLCSAATGNTIT